MKVSIVIAVHNRFGDVSELLRSLDVLETRPYEVLLIDDSDNPYRIPSGLGLNIRHYYFSRNISLGFARAFGAFVARGDAVAFIDDDAIPINDWLGNIARLHGSGCDIVGGPAYPLYIVDPPKWWDLKLFGSLASVGNYLMPNKPIWGCNFSVKKRVFKEIGYFRPELGLHSKKIMLSEEIEFIERARRRGFKICYDDSVAVYHKVYPYRFKPEFIYRRKCLIGFNKFYLDAILFNKPLDYIRHILRKVIFLYKVLLHYYKLRKRGEKEKAVIYLRSTFSNIKGLLFDRC